MSDCKLLTNAEIPGDIYDTGRGYPAAVFNKHSDNHINGEIYLMDSPANKLKELDVVESVDAQMFKRVQLLHKDMDFFSYEAGVILEDCLIPQNKITEGNWRRTSSLSFHDPISFALNFEDRQKWLYREPVTSDADGLIYIRGDIPVVITSPHSSVHKRMGKLKRQEFYCAAISVMLHSLTGCHVLYANRLIESDPNYYDESSFKAKLIEIISGNQIQLLLDLHGTGSEKDHDIYPGVGISEEFLLGKSDYLDVLRRTAEERDISIGDLHVFPAAKQMTVTKYAANKLDIPAMQLEINRSLRDPEKSPEKFLTLIKFLKLYLDSLSNLIS